MGVCNICGAKANTTYMEYGGKIMCDNCYKQVRDNDILKRSQMLQKCSDLQSWSGEDMSQLFWIHLGKYIKEPNEESKAYMRMVYNWACHANHALSNSISNALKWAKIKLY